MHCLIASTIHHHKEHIKVPSGDLFPMWFLLHTDFHLYILYTIASFLSFSLALGAQPRIKIYGSHFICCLARSNGVDTNGMTRYSLRELDEAALTWLWVVVHEPYRILRIPPDDIVVPIRQVDPEHEKEQEFEQGCRQQQVQRASPTA